MPRKRNPEKGSESILLLLGVGVAGYFAYINNWLAGIGLPYGTTTTGTAQAPAAGSTAAAVSQAGPAGVTPTAAAAASIPALGTVVHNQTDLASQAAARYPYLLPDSATISSPPSGYSLAVDASSSETGTTDGSMYLRNDVANALLGTINAGITAANVAASLTHGVTTPLATISNLYQFPFQGLSQLKSVMSSAGLSGLGFTRGRSVFPSNPIMEGAQVINAGRNWTM